jgi:zinc protease
MMTKLAPTIEFGLNMKRLIELICLSLTFACTQAFAVLPVESWTTPQGVRVFFVNAPTIPMLDIQVDFDAGSRFDARNTSGVAAITNAMIGKGVVAKGSIGALSEAQIADDLANVGAQRGSSASEDRASLTLRTLSSEAELNAAIGVFSRIVTQPSFPEPVLQREKERILQAIREAQTKPETIAAKTYSTALYGAHPYGASPSVESVSAINAADLKRFYQSYYTRDRATVSMIGAITRARAETIAIQLTSSLGATGATTQLFPPISKPATQDKRIEHPASQSHILVGTTAIARGNPDYFPLLVANYTLGGAGFVSRLYKEIRENRGLAYSVYSSFSLQSQEGPFTIGLQTKREETANALSVVKETVIKFAESGPTQEEVDAAKGNLVGGFALRIDNNRKILDNVAAVGFYRLPTDYLEVWTDKIQAVTREQAHAAFKKYVDPARLVTVVVGNAK